MSKSNKLNILIYDCANEYGDMLEKYIEKNDINSANDIISLDSYIKRILMDEKSKYRRILYVSFEIYSMILILFLLFLYKNNANMFSVNIVSTFLFFTSFFQFLTLIIVNFPNKLELKKVVRKNDYITNKYLILSTWRRIEGLANDEKYDDRYLTSDEVIEYLSKLRIISLDDLEVLKKLLKIRNDVSHNKKINYEKKELFNTLYDSELIISKLEKNM